MTDAQGPIGTVTCLMGGGLGNQLFRYAATRAIALRTGRKWIGDVSPFRDDSVYRRRWMLGSFAGPSAATLRDSSTKIGRVRDRAMRACRIRLLRDLQLIVETKPSRYSDCLLHLRAPHILVAGDWQSERYFSDVRETLLEELTCVAPIPRKHSDLVARIQGSEDPVAIAYRSYTDVSAANRSQLPTSYYARALAEIRNHAPRAKQFVFSDGPLSADVTRHIDPKATVVINPPVGADEDGLGVFMAMMRCKHFVIANSSFSWWAAWLSQRYDQAADRHTHLRRKILAPAHRVFNQDFVPDWWTSIDATDQMNTRGRIKQN